MSAPFLLRFSAALFCPLGQGVTQVSLAPKRFHKNLQASKTRLDLSLQGRKVRFAAAKSSAQYQDLGQWHQANRARCTTRSGTTIWSTRSPTAPACFISTAT